MNSTLKNYRWVATVAFVVGCFLFVNLAQADGLPLPIEAYWQKIQQTQTLVAELREVPPETARTQLLALAEEWAAITQVDLSGGVTVAVDHTLLVNQLRADPPDLVALEGRLAALLAAHDHWAQPRHTVSDAESLAAILARAEFQWPSEQPSPLGELWRWLIGKFWELISSFLPDQALITLDSSLVSYTITVLGTIALIFVLAFIILEMLRNLVEEAQIDLEAEAGDEALTADTAFKKAQTLSGGGDYRAAVRYLYLSSLLLLDERGVLRYERSQTNREYLCSVAHHPQFAAILRDVIEVFDKVWYGYQPLDEVAYAAYADRVAELRRQR